MSPDHPPTRPPERRITSWLTLAFVLACVIGGSVLLVFLPLGLLGVTVIFGSFLFAAVVGFHYFVWGYWLTRALREKEEEENQH